MAVGGGVCLGCVCVWGGGGGEVGEEGGGGGTFCTQMSDPGMSSIGSSGLDAPCLKGRGIALGCITVSVSVG